MFTSIRTWPIVALTFAAIVALSALVTIATFRSIGALRASVLDLTDTYHTRQALIEGLRSNIYASSILVRDFLLDKRSPSGNTNFATLRVNQAAAERSISELRRLSSPTSESTVRALSTEMRAYWEAIDALIRYAESDSISDDYAYVQSTILPRRQAVIALAEELADLSGAEARAGREQLNQSVSEFREDTVRLRTVATVAVVVLFCFTLWRVYRLEQAAAAEHARVEEAQAELRKLSRQLLNAQEEERRSLSRELHDHIGQMMTALRFGLSDLEQHCPAPTAPFSSALQQCRAILEGTIEAVRGIAMGLRPSMLDDLGLAAAVEWQAREFARRFDIPVTVHVDRALASCPEPQRTALYRITQEALTNCARHARAQTVRIDLTSNTNTVTLSVADDGTGIAGTEARRGFGLIGMEERVREIGGTLTIQSTAGRGTTVQVDLPLPEVVPPP